VDYRNATMTRGGTAMKHLPETATDRAVHHIMGSPYWGLMRTEKGGNGNSFIQRLALVEASTKVSSVWPHLMRGHYLLSASSPGAFGALAKYATRPEVSAIAHEIYEAEWGRRATFDFLKDKPHTDTYMEFISSLVLRLDLHTNYVQEHVKAYEEEREAFLDELQLVHDLAAFGACLVIEHMAPAIIHHLTEFVSQIIALWGLRASKVAWGFLAEHMLLEGDESDDQHIAMVREMKSHYTHHVLRSPELARAKLHYARVARRHLDYAWVGVMEEMLELR
jgi:hypothetical protein